MTLLYEHGHRLKIRVKRARVPKPGAPDALTAAAEGAVRRAADRRSARDAAIIAVLLGTGARVEECARLGVADVAITPRTGTAPARQLTPPPEPAQSRPGQLACGVEKVAGRGVAMAAGIEEPAGVDDDDTQRLLAAVAAWGRQRRDVHAIVLVGSHARTEQPADRWSDIDLVMVVDDPAPYAAGPDWLGVFGQVLLSFLEPTAVGGLVERRVLFAAGREVDVALLPLAAAPRLAEDVELAAVLGRGFRVLVDKLGWEPALRRAASRPPPPRRPTPAAFAQLTHDFWYHVLWAAKKLRRGEVWIAKQSCDGYLKDLLVGLLAWHATATDPRVDTWHGGRFLERWADQRVLEQLRGACARYDAADIARALWATAELFERVERESAERLGLPLSVPHSQVRQRLGEILAAPA